MTSAFFSKRLLGMTAAVLLAAAPVALVPAQPAQAQQNIPAFDVLAEKLLPTVVNVSSTQAVVENEENMPEMPQFPPGSPFEDFFKEFFDQYGRNGQEMPYNRPASLGSGFIIDAEKGYIVTNNHVVKDADEIKVTLHDDTSLDATLVGYDEKTDLAVLQVKTDKKLVETKWGDSDKAKVGSWVLAIGNPFGLGGTVTAGIISARQRDINAGPYDDFIQTDASINRGNSGGPMFNPAGEVIGINTAIFSPSGGSVGIGFAVPSTLAKPVIDQLIKFGKTRRGWLGVRIQEVTDEIAESLGLEKSMGALVASATEKGPADKAGIQAGDVILSFNKQDIDHMRQLPRIVAETDVGTSAPVVVWRDGKKENITVKLGELEKAEEKGLLSASKNNTPNADTPVDSTKIEPLGFSASAITDSLRQKYKIDPSQNGVVITDVEQGGAAFDKGLIEGDVVLEVNQQVVSQPDHVIEKVKAAKDAGKKSVLLFVMRGSEPRFVALKLK